MRHRSRRRSTHDPLMPVNEPRWLVVENMFHTLMESTELPPGTDLRQVLTEARSKKIAEGWVADGIAPYHCSGIFCMKEGKRIFVSIVAHDPALGPPPGHSSYG